MLGWALVALITSTQAQDSLFELLSDPASASPSLALACYNGMPISVKERGCLTQICGTQPGVSAPDPSLVPQILATPDPRTPEMRAQVEARLREAQELARSTRAMIGKRSARELVQRTLRQGPEATNNLLRAMARKAFIIYPHLDRGGMGVIYKPEIRANARAQAAAQGLAESILPQMNSDLFARLGDPNLDVPATIRDLRSYLTRKLSTLTDASKRTQLQGILTRMGATGAGQQVLGEAIRFANESGIPPMEATLRCDRCEGALEVLVQNILDENAQAPAADGTDRVSRFNRLMEVNCRAAAWGQQNMSLNGDDRTNLQLAMQRIEEGFNARVFSLFSEESRQRLEATYRIDIQPTLRDGSILPDAADLARAIPPSPRDGGALELVRASTTLDRLAETLSCHTDYVAPSDHMDPVTTSINLSPWAIKTGGAVVLAHEMGHVLNDLISHSQLSAHSAQVYHGIRACLASASGGATPGGMFPEDSVWTEEDMADFIGELAVGDLAAMSCRLLNAPYMAVVGMPAARLQRSREDSHSPLLWRALHGLVLENKAIPASCTQALEEAGTPPPRDCRPQ